MKITGHCFCGAIDPSQVRVCHCTDCQHQTGASGSEHIDFPQ
ncbi:MAG: hypothetical protein ACREFB_10715 [Stellaceae bacterium]